MRGPWFQNLLVHENKSLTLEAGTMEELLGKFENSEISRYGVKGRLNSIESMEFERLSQVGEKLSLKVNYVQLVLAEGVSFTEYQERLDKCDKFRFVGLICKPFFVSVIVVFILVSILLGGSAF